MQEIFQHSALQGDALPSLRRGKAFAIGNMCSRDLRHMKSCLELKELIGPKCPKRSPAVAGIGVGVV